MCSYTQPNPNSNPTLNPNPNCKPNLTLTLTLILYQRSLHAHNGFVDFAHALIYATQLFVANAHRLDIDRFANVPGVVDVLLEATVWVPWVYGAWVYGCMVTANTNPNPNPNPNPNLNPDPTPAPECQLHVAGPKRNVTLLQVCLGYIHPVPNLLVLALAVAVAIITPCVVGRLTRAGALPSVRV